MNKRRKNFVYIYLIIFILELNEHDNKNELNPHISS